MESIAGRKGKCLVSVRAQNTPPTRGGEKEKSVRRLQLPYAPCPNGKKKPREGVVLFVRDAVPKLHGFRTRCYW